LLGTGFATTGTGTGLIGAGLIGTGTALLMGAGLLTGLGEIGATGATAGRTTGVGLTGPPAGLRIT